MVLIRAGSKKSQLPYFHHGHPALWWRHILVPQSAVCTGPPAQPFGGCSQECGEGARCLTVCSASPCLFLKRGGGIQMQYRISPPHTPPLSAVSVTCGQPLSENIKWKIPEIKQFIGFNCVPFWVVWWNLMLSCPGCKSPLCPVYPPPAHWKWRC